MAEIPFVDTHVHFYDLTDPDLYYSWLQPDWSHPTFGDFNALKALRYDADAYLAETRFANVTKAVHIQAAIGIDDPVKETAWLQAMADRTGFPHAIVAHSELADPLVESELERHAEYSGLRGIRDFGEGDYLADPSWRRGLALLEKYGLLLDLDCGWEDMGRARDVADLCASVPIVLDHAGFPTSRTDEYRRNWQAGLSELAKADNTFCKISGFGMWDRHWTAATLRPWVTGCIEAFGVQRCLFGTNWPVDRLFSSYDPVVAAYADIIAELSRDEQDVLFFANAERVYRI